jgi:hypothetical protein
LTTKSKAVTFLTQPFDSVYAWHDKEDKTITVETPNMWVRINLRGGDISINERISGRHFCVHRIPELGPPFIEWRSVPTTYEHSLEQRDGKILVTLMMPSDSVPGITVEKTVTIGSGSFIPVDHRILNTTDAAQKLKLRCGAWNSIRGKITLPLKDGLLHEPLGGGGDFPLDEQDLSRKPEDYAESWFAAEDSGLVTGIIFGNCEEREQMTLQFDLPEMPAQSHYDLESFYLVAARGNWEVVRQMWRWLKQSSTVIEGRKPIAHPVLNASFEPAPLLIAQTEMNTRLVVQNRRGKAMGGRWHIEDCKLQIQPSEGELADVKSDSPFAQELTVTTTDLTPRLESTKIVVTDEVATRDFAAPAIILGDGSQSVNFNSESTDGKPDTVSVDNGHFSFTVAPTFLGCVTSLERNSVNHLVSAYPESHPYSFLNPWFGGIGPLLGGFNNPWFFKEEFSGEQVERTGKRGIVWHGMKLGSDLQHKDHRWMRVEYEYLTFGCSNILAVVHRLINKTNAPQSEQIATCYWLAVGGSIADNVLHYTQDRPRYEQAASTDEQTRVLMDRQPGEYMFQSPWAHWTSVENPQTGDVLTVIASHTDTGVMALTVNKDTASILYAGGQINLEPEETKEFVVWLVLGNSLVEAQEYRSLAEIHELP